jgi:hypothetical protein
MLSMITNIYNKKTKGPTLKELFTATGKLKKFFLQLEKFDVYTTGDTHLLVCPTIATWPRWPKGMDQCSSEEYLCTHVDACVARTWL